MDLNEQSPSPDAPRGGVPGDNTKAADRMATSRRAMLRAGMIGVPVVTTMMARPAWAQVVCFSPATAVSVQAAGFAGSSYQRALQTGVCEEGDGTAELQQAYTMMLQVEQQKLDNGDLAYSGFIAPDSLTLASTTGTTTETTTESAETAGTAEQATPQVTVAMLRQIYGPHYDNMGNWLFLGTFAEAFGGGPSMYMDEVLVSGYIGEQIFAAAYVNALNKELGNSALQGYPLTLAEVVALYNGDTVAGRQWSYGEAVTYLSTTLA